MQKYEQYEFSSFTEKYLTYFADYAATRISKLRRNIFGDPQYIPQNKLKYQSKQKRLLYLKTKAVRAVVEPQHQPKRKFNNYDPNIGLKPKYNRLSDMKDTLLRLTSNIEAAQQKLKQIQQSDFLFKANLYNEAAFQFDRQRYCGIGWGLIFGAFICSTIYRKGNIPRKGALFVTVGHLMGQLTYHLNFNKYYDTVHHIFQEDSKQYLLLQQKQSIQKQEPDGAGYVEG